MGDSFYSAWRGVKQALQMAGLFQPNDLHIGVGAVIFLAGYLVMRRKTTPRQACGVSLLFLLGLQIVNEGLDIGFGIGRATEPADVARILKYSVTDTIHTFGGPAILILVGIVSAWTREIVTLGKD